MNVQLTRNSLRIRCDRAEVASLLERGYLEETLALGPAPDQRLSFGVQVVPDSRLDVRYDGARLTILVPSDIARAWAASDRASVTDRIAMANGQGLDVALEKEFPWPARDDERAEPND